MAADPSTHLPHCSRKTAATPCASSTRSRRMCASGTVATAEWVRTRRAQQETSDPTVRSTPSLRRRASRGHRSATHRVRAPSDLSNDGSRPARRLSAPSFLRRHCGMVADVMHVDESLRRESGPVTTGGHGCRPVGRASRGQRGERSRPTTSDSRGRLTRGVCARGPSPHEGPPVVDAPGLVGRAERARSGRPGRAGDGAGRCTGTWCRERGECGSVWSIDVTPDHQQIAVVEQLRRCRLGLIDIVRYAQMIGSGDTTGHGAGWSWPNSGDSCRPVAAGAVLSAASGVPLVAHRRCSAPVRRHRFADNRRSWAGRLACAALGTAVEIVPLTPTCSPRRDVAKRPVPAQRSDRCIRQAGHGRLPCLSPARERRSPSCRTGPRHLSPMSCAATRTTQTIAHRTSGGGRHALGRRLDSAP